MSDSITPDPRLTNALDFAGLAQMRAGAVQGQEKVTKEVAQQFESIFINRIPQKIATNENIKFQKNTINTEGKDTTNKLIVISDGHFISNQFKNNQHLPIGFDKHTNNQYGNGDFILNCLDYLLDTKHVISVRNKDIDIRMLNKQKIQTEKFFWQVFNTFSPLGILFLIGLFILTLQL